MKASNVTGAGLVVALIVLAAVVGQAGGAERVQWEYVELFTVSGLGGGPSTYEWHTADGETKAGSERGLSLMLGNSNMGRGAPTTPTIVLYNTLGAMGWEKFEERIIGDDPMSEIMISYWKRQK